MKVLEEFMVLFGTVYYYIMDVWGGRGGARSYHLTLHALHELLYNKDFRGFFVREVHSTIYSSVWKDFKDRFEDYERIHGEHPHILLSDNKKGENIATNTITGATIVTKGFKASSKAQTANLKSLAGATHLYIEEAEETEKKAFNKLKLSLRKKGVKIKILRAFNPPPKEHWIWSDYRFEKVSQKELIKLICNLSTDKKKDIVAVVKDPKNQIELLRAIPKREKHLSINTNYGNNYENLNEEAISEMERLKYDDFLEYCTTILGLIASGSDRSVYREWTAITAEEFDKAEGNQLYGLDFGTTVPNALTHIKFDGEKRYYKELLYIPDRKKTIVDALDDLGVDKDIIIIADSASPDEIKDIRAAGYSIRAVKKGHDANQNAIKKIRNSKVYYCGDNIEDEYIDYKYPENKTGELPKDVVPKKGKDHLMDSIKYGEIGKRHAS